MGNLFEAFGTDKDLEQNGVWFEVTPGVRFLCRRMGQMNKKFKKEFGNRMKAHQRQYQQGTLDPELADSITKDTFIHSVLMDWEGVTDREGKELDFNFNNARWLFDELPDVYSAIFEESGKAGNYLVKEAEEAGNG